MNRRQEDKQPFGESSLSCGSSEIATTRKTARIRKTKTTATLTLTFLMTLIASVTGCKSIIERQSVRPLVLRDVPAQRLAYRFEPDTGIPVPLESSERSDKLTAIQTDFSINRPDDALLRTVVSPDGQRALALYGTESEPSPAFRIDMYAAEGKFLRNLIPPNLSCVFPETVAWSFDGNFITFIAHKRVAPTPIPTPPGDVPEAAPEGSPLPSPSIAPAFPSVAVFNTEQIYVCNRDGYDLKPLTAREGLIYFYYSWAPDNHALVALACNEQEWNAREKAFKLPSGRPRLITLAGKEHLLDDELADALPVWSPDASKVATAFETDVGIYDGATDRPTQARIHLRDALIAASLAYHEKGLNGKNKADNKNAPGVAPGVPQGGPPPSFNPIVRMEWPTPDKLYLQTAYVRVFPNDPINTFQRWHLLTLSPQAAVLK